MANAKYIGFGTDGALLRVRNRLGTDLSAEEPVTPAELALIRATLQATAQIVEIGSINPYDFDAAGDGATDDTEALETTVGAAVAGTAKQILLTPGTFKTSALNVPAGVALQFVPGASLQIEDGETVTIDGSVSAGVEQVFQGPGTLEIGRVHGFRPEWLGIDPVLEVESGTVLAAGANEITLEWAPESGELLWTVAPRLRVTLIDPANVEGNLQHFWATADAEGEFTLHLQMWAGVTLTSAMRFHFEVIGYES